VPGAQKYRCGISTRPGFFSSRDVRFLTEHRNLGHWAPPVYPPCNLNYGTPKPSSSREMKKEPRPLREFHEDIWLLASGVKKLKELKPFTKQHDLLERRIAGAERRKRERYNPPWPPAPRGPVDPSPEWSQAGWYHLEGDALESYYEACDSPFRVFDWVIICAVCVEFGRQLGGGTL